MSSLLLEQRISHGEWMVKVVTLVTFSIGMTDLIGCATWDHAYGIAFGTLLVTTSLFRCVLLAYGKLTEGGVPLWVALSAAVPCTPMRESYSGINNDSKDQDKRCCSLRKGTMKFRILLEFVLFMLVIVQLWGRFAASSDPSWHSFGDVKPCSDGSDNCNYLEFELPANITELQSKANSCTNRWIDKTVRTHVIFSDTTTDPAFWHVRVLSRIFPFPDDFATSVFSSNASVQVHSNARLGKSDFGVNKKRIENYQGYLLDCIQNA
eukprot:TRINITY_DN5388_c0_g1_i1.p1 TRINITY_DN5388_c0_g1~~TRINITY_DN5388_c0_g1_i1.p1  ORF type:complete len:278 (+),score=26.54 TRINITY_DN5388_c0_g1_i1:42-836(+)